MDKKAQQYKIPGVLDLKKEPITVYTEYIDAIKRGGTKYVGNDDDAPVESVGPATEFCRPCFAYVQPGHTCPTWTKAVLKEATAIATNPKKATPAEIEAHVRRLLGLPECSCGQGLYCPEIVLNGPDPSGEVLAYLKGVEQDAVVAYVQEWWTP